MKWRDWLSALIGVWFVIAPWTMGFNYDRNATWLSVFFGGLQILVSIWAAAMVERPSWRIWQNWIAVITGFWFIIHPFLGTFDEGPYWGIAGPGIATMILNLWTLMAPPADMRGGSRRNPDGGDTEDPDGQSRGPRGRTKNKAGV